MIADLTVIFMLKKHDRIPCIQVSSVHKYGSVLVSQMASETTCTYIQQ